MTVSFGRDALSGTAISSLFAYIDSQKTQFRWNANVLNWSPALLSGNAAVLTHMLPESLINSIYGELAHRKIIGHMPREKVAMFYVWLPGSSITWHADYPDRTR